jgi:PAS domain S-box-containing protein
MENRIIKVLLIEDSTDDAELIKRKLEKSATLNFQVTIASKLDDGLKQAEKDTPDLILSDLGLPDSHGLDTVTKILLANPGIPLVVLSGFDDEDTAIKAVKSGAQDYLVKGQLDSTQWERSLVYSVERARLHDELDRNTQEISNLHVNLLKILENNTDAIVVVSKDKRILFTNPAVASIFGQKPKELLNMPFRYPLNAGKTSEIEINRPDEEITIAEMSVVGISWEGKPAYLVSMHDITGRKQMEDALRTSEAKYRDIVEMAQDGIITLNLQGQITSCNEAFARMGGVSIQDIVGKHFSEIPFVIPKELESYKNLFASLLRDGKIPALEIVWPHKDGTIRTSELRASLMKHNKEIIGIQAMVLDITERKNLEKTLVDEATRRRILIEQSGDGIVIIDQTGKVYDANQRFADMLGYTLNEVRQLYIFDWEYLYKREQILEMIQTVDENGAHFETKHRRKDGTTYDVELSNNGATFAGQKLVFCVCRDITERQRMEMSIKESEAKFSKAFMNSPLAMVISSLDNGIIVDVNDTFLGRSGYQRKDVIGKNIVKLNIGESQEERDKIVKLLKENKPVKNIERQFHNINGVLHTSLFSAETINVANQPCMLSVTVDITERKKMEELLRFSDTALKSINEGIFATDIDNRITHWNKMCEQIISLTEQEVIGKLISDIVKMEEEYPGQNEKRLELLMKKGANREEQVYLTPRGRVWVDVQAQAVIENGKRTGWITLITDISERKKTEEALKQSEEKYRELINSSTDAIISADADMRVILWNHGAERIFGYTEKEMMGQSLLSVIPEHVHKQMTIDYKYLDKTIGKQTENTAMEVNGIRKDGSVMPGEMTISVIKAGDSFITTAIIRDITIRKEAEEKLKKIDQMKAEFLSNVSHELRTPMQSISGFIKLILTGKVPDPAVQQEFLQIIDNETMHLGNLINSLLDMSRLEAGRFQIYKKPMAVQDVITDSLKMFHSLAKEKDITLNESISAKLPQMDVDSERIRQVIINLLGNAVKFSDPGTSINVKAAVQDGELLFQVTDHGIGIKEDSLTHLFERFYRSEGEKVRGGTGLGLYISKQIIDAHGGRIWAESKFGEGSTFSFTLPVATTGGKKNGEENTNHRRRSGNTKTGRLLS